MVFTRLANGLVKLLLVIIIAVSVAVMTVVTDGTNSEFLGVLLGIAVFLVGSFIIMGIGVMTEIAVNIEKIRKSVECGTVNLQSHIDEADPKNSVPLQGWICGNCGSLNKADYIFCKTCVT